MLGYQISALLEEEIIAHERSEPVLVNYVLPFIREQSVILLHGDGDVLAAIAAHAILECPGVRFLLPESSSFGLAQKLKTKIFATDIIQEKQKREAIFADANTTAEGELGATASVQTKSRVAAANAALQQPLRYRLGGNSGRGGGSDDDDETFQESLNERIEKSLDIIPDASVAQLMPDIDFVLSGANAITEHGGVVHYMGSYQVALLASVLHVPYYVAAPTFKFAHVFPMSTKDLLPAALADGIIGNGLKQNPLSMDCLTDHNASSLSEMSSTAASFDELDDSPAQNGKPTKRGGRDKRRVVISNVELVPPNLVTMVFTEAGIMPPTSVADLVFRLCSGGQPGR